MTVFFKDERFPVNYDPNTDRLHCIGICNLCPAQDPRHKKYEDCRQYFARATATLEHLCNLTEQGLIEKEKNKTIFFKNNEFQITYNSDTDKLDCIGFCDLCPAKDPQNKTYEECKNYFARAAETIEKLHNLTK